MYSLDLTGKTALVTGVGDNQSFAWYISKALKAAGAKVVLAVHPRMYGIVESFLTRDSDRESRLLPDGSEFTVEKMYACDASFDTMEQVPEKLRTDRRYAKFTDYSIKGTIEAVGQEFGGFDVLIHSIAFSREITKPIIETSREAYSEALGISSYSLISMVRYAAPFMANRKDGGSVVGLTYIGGDRVIPHYGGGMSTAKTALQMDAKQLSWFVGDKNIRVNLISAGPYASRAARAINPDFDKLIEHAAAHSPLRRPIGPEEVANSTLYLCSPLASAVTGQVLYVDCGYNVMGT
ncbi:SDR family oxidoreductase [Limnoglobus roseus]|uniref:Enoyl-[acyl-carrier-protein] reductase [NADH] n=1 Tax=Limnoglobus roseus TaxID=2598579 RepID=A0A5C1ABI6_9BACT|nr:SDR family oxidoreductase [Limnoglobus roseus]QEL16611.1 enoyl-ACP reductase [Limnoglobus roseus]